MKSSGLLSSPLLKLIEPREATREELLLFHEPDYLGLVKEMSDSGFGYLDMGDTPAFKGCYEASALAVGASLEAVDFVMEGRGTFGMNIAGGLHHAHPGRASGFCIFNDPAISIAYLKKKYSIERVLYLDVDAHHGDGVMYGFYSDPGVLDIDFHEDGRHLFPGTGFVEENGQGHGKGFKINVPLAPFTGDDAYLWLFDRIVPIAVREFKPRVILIQCGADGHANDLLAHLQLTTRSYLRIIRAVRELAQQVAGGRLIVFGGGGYNIANVARTWTLVASALLDFEPPELIPKNWQKMFEGLVGEKSPGVIHSDTEANEALMRKVPADQPERIIESLKRVSPLLGS